jgi:hypothetical protein
MRGSLVLAKQWIISHTWFPGNDHVGRPAQAQPAFREARAPAIGPDLGERFGERVEEQGHEALLARFAAAARGGIAVLKTSRQRRPTASSGILVISTL